MVPPQEPPERTDQGDDSGREAPATGDNRDLLLFSYQMLVMRGQTQANLVWQTPSLGLTAQAFLLTIALEAELSDQRRMLAALLGLVVALISMQTMAKHRFFESLDNYQLQRLEGQLGLPPIASRGWQNDTPSSGDGFPLPQKKGPIQWSSYKVWMIGLAIFAVVDVLLMALYLTHWSQSVFNR